MVTIRYNGWTYEGRIISEMIRYGERFYTVTWNKGRVEKCLHESHIQTKTA